MAGFLSGQIKDPVKFRSEIASLGGDVYEVILHATLEKGWHIYSKDLPPDSGIPTEMKVSFDQAVEKIGGVVEVGKKHDEFSEAFGTQIVYYSDKVDFKQKFRVKGLTKPLNARVEIRYQTCDDRVCLAPNTLELEAGISPVGVLPSAEEAETKDNPAMQPSEMLPSKDEKVDVESAPVGVATNVQKGGMLSDYKIQGFSLENVLVDCGGQLSSVGQQSNLWIMALGFVGGLVALLTPCVFPMIPLTVSFFTKGAENKLKGRRDAVIYGVFILLIFVALSIPFHIIDGVSGNIFNQISTSVWLNVVFFVVFVFFAFSFFGYYEITLPSWIANKSAQAEEAGGVLGIFFMALTLVIVSFSCTGPILGSLLGGVASTSSNIPTLLTFALMGFGLSWAFVFGALALFPQALASLPKSGSWMNTVKVVLGFVELALALKFLSKADLVSKTFLIKRELFVGIWILLAGGLGAYLLGFIRFKYDSKEVKPRVSRKVFGLLSFLFMGYLVWGLFPSEKPRLQMLSGILPPVNVSYFASDQHGVLGLKAIDNYEKAIQEARIQNKPLLIDFTGFGCENCRKMEEFVWSEPDILPLLQEKVVLASLYVDDKESLPVSEQTMVPIGEGQKKKIQTIGDRWSLFQQINFKNNSQPHYVLLTPEGRLINRPVSGYMSKEDFRKFLECGIGWYQDNYQR